MAFAPSSNPKPLSSTAPPAKPSDESRQRSQSQSQPPDSKSTTSSSHPNPPVHKRVYQACIPCRRRKVRCDLGSVDNPHDPPCVRCRRESKECFFSATRRKRKADDPDGDIESDEYVIRNGRKRLQADPLPLDRSIYGGEIPLTPGGSLGRREPLRRPDGRGGRANREFSSGGEDSNAPLANLEAQEVMRDRVYGQHDALDLLYKAATDRFVHHRSPSTTITTTVTNTTANSITAAVISSSSSTIAASQYASQTPAKPPTTVTSPWRGTFTAPPGASVALSMVSGLQGATATTGGPGFHSGVGVPAGSAPSGSSLFAAAATASSLFPLDYEGFGANLDLRGGSPTISARPEPSRAASVTGSNIATPTAGHLRKHSKADGPMSMPMPDQGIRGQPPLNAEDALEEALKSWGRFRFVRAGWFTAQEAIAYIDYYYTYLSPLTPISPPTFRNPASHTTLLSEEPILTVTLLTITSRYMKLSGPGGHCRSNAIHEQLWTYLRGMIERCLWGQEAFGGRLHPSGPTEDFQTSSTAPWRGLRKGSLRTLGTIESLMILTEWHPRALHFPPAEAIDELMLPSYEATLQNDAEQRQFHESGSFGGKRIESWLEPAWRSDRMCWMLLSTAMGLAYELGVFDNIDELLRDGAVPRPEYEEEGYRQRAYRIKRLLLIYLTQLAGRLGWKNMVPEQLWKSDPAVSRKRRDTVEGMTPASHGSLANTFNYIPDLELDDQIIHCWAGVSNTMHIGNERLFKSRKHTTEIIQSGLYVDLLREFQPMLHNWWNEFDRFRLPPYIRHILTIEYEYVRIYINSLSLQAVVERCTNNAGNHTVPTTVASTDTGDASTTGTTSGAVPQLSPQTQNYYGKLPLGQLGGLTQADQVYIREVVDGCRNLLRTVVDGLLPKGYLKHAPVRTYFRIISGAMFLLKTFALGAPRSDVKISIRLMDEAVEALRNCVVDDVHLGVRFADLLETLTSRLRTRFIQAPIAQTNGAAANTKDGQQPTATTTTDYPSRQPKVPESTSPAVAIIATPFDMPFPVPPAAAPNHNASVNPNPDTVDTTTTATLDAAGLPVNPSGVAVPPHVVPPTVTGFKDWTAGDDMWYLPPGAAFFQNMENNNVQMTAEGINVGGADLLDYMMDFPNIDGGAATFQ